MQAMGRNAAKNSKSRRVMPYQPRTKSQVRKWWWSVIEQHYKIGTSVRDTYGKRFPYWLETEVQRTSPQIWLASYDRKTGKRRQRLDNVKVVAKIPVADIPKNPSIKRGNSPKKGILRWKNEDPAVIARRLNRHMEGVEVVVRRSTIPRQV